MATATHTNPGWRAGKKYSIQLKVVGPSHRGRGIIINKITGQAVLGRRRQRETARGLQQCHTSPRASAERERERESGLKGGLLAEEELAEA